MKKKIKTAIHEIYEIPRFKKMYNFSAHMKVEITFVSSWARINVFVVHKIKD